MRKPYLVAAAAALAMVAGGIVVYADAPDADAESSGGPAPSRSVTLTTGDVVTVGSEGDLAFRPADDRRDVGYVAVPAMDGSKDVTVIPADKIADLAAGEADPRRFNVSALLREGQTDAATADMSAMGGQSYGQFVPVDTKRPETGADTRPVKMTFTDHDGKPAADMLAVYFNVETGDAGELEVAAADDGTASAELPPGDYDILSSAFNAGGESVSAITPLTVADEPVTATVDGTKATPVEAEVDSRDTEAVHETIEVGTSNSGGYGQSITTKATVGANHYALPVEAGKTSARKFSYKATMTPQGTKESNYNLAFQELDGIPDDLEYAVSEDELAAVATKYHRPAGAKAGHASACGLFDWETVVMCLIVPLDESGQLTQYYTTGDEITWSNKSLFVGNDGDELIVDQDDRSYEAGPSENSFGAGPFGPHLNGGGISRYDDTLLAAVSHLGNPDPTESVRHFGTTGSTTLSKDGEQIDKIDHPAGELKLPKSDSGRYTLTVDAALASEVTPLATKASATWEFESKPVDSPTPVDLSSVIFDAENVVDGSAPAGESQPFTLDYQAQDGASETKAEQIGFEVSYDDGETWQEVKVELEGNTASGTLEHPADAEFVSYRVAAQDDTGNSYKATAVRSYALS